MTKAIKAALKSVKIPTIQFSDRYGQYWTRIGYRESRTGKRQQAFFYLGTDEPDAVGKAAELKGKWRAIKREQGKRALWPSSETVLAKAIAPTPALATVSPDEIKAMIADFHRGGDEQLAELDVEQIPSMQLEQVRQMFDAYRKGKIGVGGDQGIKASTYKSEAENLSYAFRFITGTMMIARMDFPGVEAWKDEIFKTKHGLSKRTAVNYCRAMKAMLNWAHTQPAIPYRKPDDFETLFKFRKFTPVKIEAYEPKTLKELLAEANDKTRLHIYLALNCGHTQVDIGSLRESEIITYQGKKCIVRRRDKTSHQNDFESLHVLWAETVELIEKMKAPKNDHGRLLLNAAGEPIYRNDENSARYDSISDAWDKVCTRSGRRLSFKQFRKLGASAMERLGGQQPRRLYKAGSIDSGDKVYVKEAFENLTPHLLKWGEELRKDGVLYFDKAAEKKVKKAY